MRQSTFEYLSFAALLALAGCGRSNAGGPSGDDAGNSADSTTAANEGDASDSDGAKVLPGALSVTACPGTAMTTVPSNAPSCDTICGAAHCVPASLTGANPSLPDCPDDGTGTPGRCVPDPIFMWEGHFQSPPCNSSVVKGPAACVPYCFTGIFKDVLKQDSCAKGEVCSPCTNPTTNQPTGACTDRCEDDGGLDGATSDDAGSASDVADAAHSPESSVGWRGRRHLGRPRARANRKVE